MIISVGWIVVYALTIINLTHAAIKHGEPRNEDYDFWVSLISNGIWIALIAWIAGGFF